jgi:diadenosine tetraphosphate (Ap4A) HIT family hydrolase
MGCELCEGEGGSILWRDDFCRVVRPVVPEYPGLLRVILRRHVAEMTDLAPAERRRLMETVFACEQALRSLFRPDKVNLASLGNQVPHLHWHVIARHRDDAHFPNPIWSPGLRTAAPSPAVSDQALREALERVLGVKAA